MRSSASAPIGNFPRPRVWLHDLDADRRLDFLSLLPASEIARAERLKSPAERRRCAARCAFVRLVLGNLVGVAPSALEIRHGTHGKPRLAFPGSIHGPRLPALAFNLSHTENVLALAVSFGRDVGIDIEAVEPGIDVLAVAEAHFTAEERACLRKLPANERTIAFYRLWTRRESLAKATGCGITSRLPVEICADSQWMLHSFEFKLGNKRIIGALALALGGESAMEAR